MNKKSRKGQFVKINMPDLFDPCVLFGYIVKKTDFGKHKVEITHRYARAFVRIPRFNFGKWACYFPLISRLEGYWVSDIPDESIWYLKIGEIIEIEDKYITESKLEDMSKYEKTSEAVLTNPQYLVSATPM